MVLHVTMNRTPGGGAKATATVGRRWSGVPCRARRVVVEVAVPSDAAPQHWARPYAGTLRNAVEVVVGSLTLYLDDQGFARPEPQREAVRVAATQIADLGRMSYADALQQLGGDGSTVGFPGWGWAKVCAGGDPDIGHADVPVARVVRER